LKKQPRKDSVGSIPARYGDRRVSFPIASLPDHLELGVDEVHVWQAGLDGHETTGLRALLAADEISRADRFLFANDREHFIAARALLRTLLGAYLDIAAAEVRFAYEDKGKPALADRQPRALKFNLAHSHGRALYGLSRGRELGVDLEFVKEEYESEKIAERFFSPFEIAKLGLVPAKLKPQAFFECWTRKEAYLKARGTGLSLPLDEFDVSFGPGETAALLRSHDGPEEVARWSMRSIDAPDGYVAALVVEGHDWTLRTFALEAGFGDVKRERS
jgi:4'-phosphopantetheinyl transferase